MQDYEFGDWPGGLSPGIGLSPRRLLGDPAQEVLRSALDRQDQQGRVAVGVQLARLGDDRDARPARVLMIIAVSLSRWRLPSQT